MKKYTMYILTTLLCMSGIAFAGTMYAKENNHSSTERAIVETQHISCALKTPYKSIQDISKASNLIILGSSEEAESFTTKNGLIWTKEKIKVIGTLKGSKAPETIYVYKMGGEVPVEEYVDSFDPKVRELRQSQYDEYNSSGLVKQIFYEEEFPDANTPQILFLRKITKFGQHEESYEPIGDYMGVYVSNISYQPKATPSNASTPSDATEISDDTYVLRDTDYDGYFGTFSYQELENMIR